MRLAPLNRLKPSSKYFTDRSKAVLLLRIFNVFVLFICALWSPAGKGLTSWLSFVVSAVSLSLSHWYPVSGVVLDCIDSCSLHPYLLLYIYFVDVSFGDQHNLQIFMSMVLTCY